VQFDVVNPNEFLGWNHFTGSTT